MASELLNPWVYGGRERESAMSEQSAAVPQPAATGSFAECLFRALLECLQCRNRRASDIYRGEYRVLRREGTVNFKCPHCGRFSAHRLVRMC